MSEPLELAGHLESERCLRVEGRSSAGAVLIGSASTVSMTARLVPAVLHSSLRTWIRLVAEAHWRRLTGGKARRKCGHLSVSCARVGPSGSGRSLLSPCARPEMIHLSALSSHELLVEPWSGRPRRL